MTDETIDVKTEDKAQTANRNGSIGGSNTDENNGNNNGKNSGLPDDIPEVVWNTYVAAFMQFRPDEQRKPVKSCEKQIGQLERRIARKKGQENHQILADMKDLHRRTAAIGYTVTGKTPALRKKFRHALRMLIRLDLSFWRK